MICDRRGVVSKGFLRPARPRPGDRVRHKQRYSRSLDKQGVRSGSEGFRHFLYVRIRFRHRASLYEGRFNSARVLGQAASFTVFFRVYRVRQGGSGL